MAVEISYINDFILESGSPVTYIFGDGFKDYNSIEIWNRKASTVYTNEFVITTDSVLNYVRKKKNVMDYIDNGYTIPSWSTSDYAYGGLTWTVHTDSIISYLPISLVTDNYTVPVYVTNNARAEVSSPIIQNKPEIFNFEASIYPSVKKISPAEYYVVYGRNLSAHRNEYPSVWLLEDGEASSTIFEIETGDEFDGTDYNRWCAFDCRFYKKAAPATLTTTAVVNANDQVDFVAVSSGTGGNSIRITFVDTGSLSISVASNDITVNVDAGVTTAAQVVAAVNADSSAKALVRAFVGWRGDGSGAVGAFGLTNLTGGIASGAVPDGTYYLLTSKDHNHYGVAMYDVSFTIDTTTESVNTIDTSSFVYNGVSYSLDETDTPDEQTKALQTAMMAAYRMRHDRSTTVNDSPGTGTSFIVTSADNFIIGDTISVGADTGLIITNIDYGTETITVNSSFTWANGETVTALADTSRVKIDIAPGHYWLDRPIVMVPGTIIDPEKYLHITFQADPNGFDRDTIGAGYPTPPSGSGMDFTYTLSNTMFHLQGQNTFANCKMIGSLTYSPENPYPAAMFIWAGDDSNIENVDIYHLAHEEDLFGQARPVGFACWDANNCRTKNINAKCKYVRTVVGGFEGKYHIADTIKAEGINNRTGGIGRCNGELSIYKDIYFTNFYRGFNFTGVVQSDYRSLVYRCVGHLNGLSHRGAELVLWETENYALDNFTHINSTSCSGQSTYTPVAYVDWILINEGKGQGQYRRITNVSGSAYPGTFTLTLDRAWDINPDSNSYVAVGPNGVENVIARCSFYNQIRAICFYGGCHGNIVSDCNFSNVNSAIWFNSRRAPGSSNLYDTRTDLNWHNYFIYNKFDKCDQNFVITTSNFKEGNTSIANEAPLADNLYGGGFYFTQNSFSDGTILFCSSRPPHTDLDWVAVSFNYNRFDVHLFPAITFWGQTSAEFIYPQPRSLIDLPIVIGGENQIWPIRELNNLICGQITTTRSGGGTDSVTAVITGGSETLWGPQNFRVDSANSSLPQPVGYPYYENDWNLYNVSTGNSPDYDPNIQPLVEEDIVGIGSDVAAIKAQTDQLSFTGGSVNATSIDVAAIKAKTDLLTFTGNDVKATLDSETVKLSSDGLDNLSVSPGSGPASSFREMIVRLYLRFFGRTKYDKDAKKIYTYNSGETSTPATTQNVTDGTSAQIIDEAS